MNEIMLILFFHNCTYFKFKSRNDNNLATIHSYRATIPVFLIRSMDAVHVLEWTISNVLFGSFDSHNDRVSISFFVFSSNFRFLFLFSSFVVLQIFSLFISLFCCCLLSTFSVPSDPFWPNICLPFNNNSLLAAFDCCVFENDCSVDDSF